MGKKWKVVDGHPNYEVSRMGQVRNIRTGNILAPYDDGSGYLRVKLDGENCRLHILVAVAHVPNPDPETKNIVNHKRGKKHDCRASQLEWVTQAENIQHAWDTGLCKRKRRRKVVVVTCKDCQYYSHCLESSREYPCKDFKKKEGETSWRQKKTLKTGSRPI